MSHDTRAMPIAQYFTTYVLMGGMAGDTPEGIYAKLAKMLSQEFETERAQCIAEFERIVRDVRPPYAFTLDEGPRFVKDACDEILKRVEGMK